MERVPDWSALQTELLETIARCCTVMEDFMAFRGVCTSWRAAAAKDVFVSVSKVLLLMLAEKKGTNEREFYSLAKRKICARIPLPELMAKRCNDVGFGWILTKASDGEVCLMKPFSSERIRLPNFKEFPDYSEHECNPEAQFIHRAWLTANLSETLKFTLLVDGYYYLGFWNSGAENWTKIEGQSHFFLTCWKEKIYVLDLEGRLLVCDSQDVSSNHNWLVVRIENGPTKWTGSWKEYLVRSSDGGQLLLIRRDNTGYKDFVRGEMMEVNDLGKDAVFLGDNAAVSVDATEFPGVLKPNCIYFTDDCFENYSFAYTLSNDCLEGGGKDMGIYNVVDGSIERFDVDSESFTCPPMWIFPSF